MRTATGRYFRLDTDTEKISSRGRVYYHVGGDKYFYLYPYRGREQRRYAVRVACGSCREMFFCEASNYKQFKSSYCSPSCQASGRSGPGAHNWSGGRKLKRGKTEASRSHVLVYAPDHPNAKKNYVPEHRLVVEADIGRYLSAEEVVHHVDCDPQNNLLDNLVVMSIRQHNLAHGSLNRCVKELMTSGGRVVFCRETFTYEVEPI